ncbi:PQQ-dependent sugar dehydrogenase [Ornithinimicrobium faecis]|uniref:PQQ-dependent sugar dehydrogenase n=1 Tax=Ornithinimicrobium faecis TaxID=2934158 RepID=A0ABY4YT14_9MICO|nr:PQQ-dependent sugar dehydrogenase [Ornithinimicrobium sp. HY1793]USQ79287.1 PQQ-dependent sugar dehydrogenase [Ornithinimicrobium sp. HY1793]
MRGHLVATVALGVALLAGCSEDRVPTGADPSNGSTGTGPSDRSTGPGPDESVATVATGFEVPWGLVPLDDGSLLVGERETAQVFRVVPGSDPSLLTTVPGVAPDGEGGLLGLAVPDDSAWHDGEPAPFFAYATTDTDNRVLRVEPGDGSEPAVEVVLDGIPKAGNHNGGRIAFGPDGYLYVTTGDASDGASAQDPDSLAGKILRITAEGAPAPDNPDPGSPVLSLGHRNVQGLDWDSSGRLWASEFGQNALDEVNLIQPGGNYGWPQVEGPGGEPEFIDPVVSWPTQDASPSGLAVGADGALYVAALRGESLWRVPLTDADTGTDAGTGTGTATGTDPGSVTVGEPERLYEGEFGRQRSVVTGPDGELWVLTSNTFRGDPAPDDDRLLRLDPAAQAGSP